MKIIHQPRVYLLGRQIIDDQQLQQFLADHQVEPWTTDTDLAGQKLCEVAGRVCYMSFARPRPGGNREYLTRLVEVGHGSVLEHAVWNFVVAGVSRSFTHELVRHRAGFGYSQLSQRYVDESAAEFVEPACIAEHPAAHKLWVEAVGRAQEAYCQLAEILATRFAEHPDQTMRRKLARQAARSVLPNATETKIFVTANARALRHFVELRGSEHADPEIRKVANLMLGILEKEAPNLFGDYRREPLPDGTSVIRTAYPKV
jgi:thymidylate synthase (FAD)